MQNTSNNEDEKKQFSFYNLPHIHAWLLVEYFLRLRLWKLRFLVQKKPQELKQR